MLDFESYISPFSWRYSSPEMRKIWSEKYKRRLWRKIWVALAEVQSEFGLVKPDQLVDLQNNVENVTAQQDTLVKTAYQNLLNSTTTAFCIFGSSVKTSLDQSAESPNTFQVS